MQLVRKMQVLKEPNVTPTGVLRDGGKLLQGLRP